MCQGNSTVWGKVRRIAPASNIPGVGGILEVVPLVDKIDKVGKVCFRCCHAEDWGNLQDFVYYMDETFISYDILFRSVSVTMYMPLKWEKSYTCDNLTNSLSIGLKLYNSRV